MGISKKFVALLAVVAALAMVPAALASGLKIVTTPTHPKLHQKVQMKVSGLKPNEKVKAVLTLPASGQKNTYTVKANAQGVFINTVTAQVKGKNVWTYTGKSSHRSGSTSFTVR